MAEIYSIPDNNSGTPQFTIPIGGMCVSRPDIRMSLVFIGRATSSPQHWDTIAHECLYHASVAIHEYYDIPFGSEDGAWLTGFLMRQAVRLLGEPCK